MKIKNLWAVSALLAVAGSCPDAWAGKEPRLHFQAQDVRQGDVVVPKEEVWNKDVLMTGSVLVEGTVNGDCASMGGPVTINGTVTKDAAAIGGAVTIIGTVKGDAASVGGPLRVAGSVAGDVSSMGGDITLEPAATVGGDVSVVGGKLIRAEGARVGGKVTQADLSAAKRLWMPLAMRLKYLPEIRTKVSPFKRALGFVMFVVFWGGLGLMAVLIALFFPKNLEAAAACVKSDFWRAGGAGALLIMLTLPAFILLAVSILGLPLIPLAILLYCAAVFLALAACSLALGRRFCEMRRLPAPTTLAGTGMGFGLLVAFLLLAKLITATGSVGAFFGGFLFLVGLLVLSGALIVGLGAVSLTRFGLRPPAERLVAAPKAAPPPAPAAA